MEKLQFEDKAEVKKKTLCL